MQPFQSLSERGQARRLRRMAFQTLQTYDLDVDRVRLITNNLNAIFRLDSHHGDKYILRETPRQEQDVTR